jgi:hypothetical protein
MIASTSEEWSGVNRATEDDMACNSGRMALKSGTGAVGVGKK